MGDDIESKLPDNGALIGAVLGTVLGYFSDELKIDGNIYFGLGVVVTVFTFVHDSIGLQEFYTDCENFVFPQKPFVISTIGGIFVGKGLKKEL